MTRGCFSDTGAGFWFIKPQYGNLSEERSGARCAAFSEGEDWGRVGARCRHRTADPGCPRRLAAYRPERSPRQAVLGLAFHPVDNDQLVAYSKVSEDGADKILVVANVDPRKFFGRGSMGKIQSANL